MKKTLIATTIASATLVFTNTVLASENKVYVGASYDMMQIDSDLIGSFDSSVLSVKAGTNFTENLGIEIVAGAGITDSSKFINNLTVTGQIKNYYGAYLTGTYPINDKFNITSKLGYANTTIEFKNNEGVKASDDDSGISWGIGASLRTTENVILTADYTMLTDESYGDITGFTFGAKYTF